MAVKPRLEPMESAPPAPRVRLPVSSEEVLAGLAPERTLALEERHGNGDLIRVLKILGVIGPFKVISPWELEDEEGRHLINAGGYAALPFGEHYPPLVDFLRRYLDTADDMSLPQQSASPWRAALETALVGLLSEVAPSHEDSQVFFSNSGAGAVEAAIKFVRAARPKAPYFLNFTRSYHGKTFGALGLTPNEDFQVLFRPLMPNVVTLPYGDSLALQEAVTSLGPKKVAGIILEPLQGEAGVIAPPADFLPTIETIRRQHGILVIADEVQTGLGRTGHLFASVAGGLDPDIVTLAKPLGGGMVAIGATIARKWVTKKSLGGVHAKRHSNTFGGGSLAMAVGLKSLELILEEGLPERALKLGARGRLALQELQKRHPELIQESRSAGMLFALQLKPLLPAALSPVVERGVISLYNSAFRPLLAPKALPVPANILNQLSAGLAIRAFHEAGVHVCFSLNASRTVRLTPALNMPESLFDEMLRRVEAAATRCHSTWGVIAKAPGKTSMDLVRLALFG